MITVRLYGGLGNQLFQYAAARRLSLKHNTPLKLYIDDLVDFHDNPIFGLDNFNIKAEIIKKEEALKHFPYLGSSDSDLKMRYYNYDPENIQQLKVDNVASQRFYHFDSDVLTLPDNICLEGSWQSEKYFQDYREEIVNELSVASPIEGKNKQLAEQISGCESVSLHIRRREKEYITHPEYMNLYKACDIEFYYHCMDYIAQKVSNPHFFVFTDALHWISENLSFKYPVTIVDHNGFEKDYEDLRLMSLCKHNIIADSSFSWWGAWLNKNPSKIVCGPETFFTHKNFDQKDLIPESWSKVANSYKEIKTGNRNPHVLICSQKFLNGKPELGRSADDHNFVTTLSGLATHDRVNVDQCHEDTLDYEVLLSCARNRPDFIFIVNWLITPLKKTTLKVIRDILKIPVVVVLGDSVNHIPLAESIYENIDLFITIDSHTSYERCENRDKFMAMWTPEDTNLYYDSQSEREIDVCFIGKTLDLPKRKEYVDYLKENGIKVYQSGGQREQRLSVFDYAGIFQKSKISLNFCKHPNGKDQSKGRIFESTLSGAMLIEEENEESAYWLKPGTDYISFKDKNELLKKVKYYLEHEDERSVIAQNGFKKSSLKYTGKTFWDKVFKRVLPNGVCDVEEDDSLNQLIITLIPDFIQTMIQKDEYRPNFMLENRSAYIVNHLKLLTSDNKKYALYGAGKHSEWMIKLIDKYELPRPSVIIDDSSTKKSMLNCPVLNLADLDQSLDFIIISSDQPEVRIQMHHNITGASSIKVIDLYENFKRGPYETK